MVDLSNPPPGQQPMSPTRPHAAPRARTHQHSPTQEPEQQDTDASVSITINIPANLAAEANISVMLTPRSSRISRAQTMPQITPLRFATPSPSPSLIPSPIRQCAQRRAPAILHPSDPVYPRPPGSVHPNDPVPNIPTRSRRFYCVFQGSKIGVFWDSWAYIATISKDIGGHWRKADTYEQAMVKWDTTPASQKEVFTAD